MKQINTWECFLLCFILNCRKLEGSAASESLGGGHLHFPILTVLALPYGSINGLASLGSPGSGGGGNGGGGGILCN